MTTIYLTDPQGIYLGPSLADPDPLDSGNWLVPRFAYMDAPPDTADREIAKRQGDIWTVVPDWRGYEYWLPDGSKHTIGAPGVLPPANALDAAPAPTPVKTTVVTMRQCQLALLAAGLLDQVDAVIAVQARAVRITWATAATVERGNPLIASLADALGLTSVQVDALFEQAALL